MYNDITSSQYHEVVKLFHICGGEGIISICDIAIRRRNVSVTESVRDQHLFFIQQYFHQVLGTIRINDPLDVGA